MKTEAKKNDRGELRRQLILDTTLRMIAAGGVDSVTHRRVANAAKIPLGSTTYYFDSRDHLLREAFDYLVTRSTNQQYAYWPDTIRSQQTLVDYLVESTHRQFDDEALLLAEYEMTLFAARDAHVAQTLADWESLIIKEISSALKSLGARHHRDGAKTILNLMRGYELERLSRHELDSTNFKKRLKVVVAALVGSEKE